MHISKLSLQKVSMKSAKLNHKLMRIVTTSQVLLAVDNIPVLKAEWHNFASSACEVMAVRAAGHTLSHLRHPPVREQPLAQTNN